MPHKLEVPHTPARRSFEAKQRVRKKIIAMTIRPVEIVSCRARRYEDQSTFLIQGHTTPVVCPTNVFPRIFRPGLVSELARMGNRVENPTQLAGACVIGSNMPRS